MVSQAFLISGAPVFCMLLCFFFRKATRKQVLVNRCSRTHVSSISSLVERILAGTEHTSFFLCWLPLAGSSERRRRDVECFCCTVSHGFFMNVYISLPLPSWKSHLLVRKFVCAVLFQSHGSSHSLSCVITGIFVVNVWAFKKKKLENLYSPCCGRSSRGEVLPVGVIWMNCCLRGNGWGTRAMVQKGIVNFLGKKEKSSLLKLKV